MYVAFQAKAIAIKASPRQPKMHITILFTFPCGGVGADGSDLVEIISGESGSSFSSRMGYII